MAQTQAQRTSERERIRIYDICLRGISRKYIIFKSIVNLFSRYNLQCFVQPFVRRDGRVGGPRSTMICDWNQFEKKSLLMQFSYELDEIASREYLIDLIYLLCMRPKGTKIWCGNIDGSTNSVLFNPFADANIVIATTAAAAAVSYV